jgi:hypothetical protein
MLLPDRKLTEDEVNSIANSVCDKMLERLYKNTGSGMFSLLWKGILIGIIAIAAYGVGIKHLG